MTKGYLQKKGGKYYAMMSWYDGSGDRHFQSVGLQISTDRNAINGKIIFTVYGVLSFTSPS